MTKSDARTVLLVIASWVMGALMGSQIQRPRANQHNESVRFPAGLYQIEPTDDGDGPVYWLDYPAEWQARLLTR